MTNDFNNSAADGDLSNSANWSLGHIPDATEDVTLSGGTPAGGSVVCKNVSGGTVNGGTWDIKGTLTSVIWTGGFSLNPITASSSTWSFSPSCAITSTGGCIFGAGVIFGGDVKIAAGDTFGTGATFGNVFVPVAFNFGSVVVAVSTMIIAPGVAVNGLAAGALIATVILGAGAQVVPGSASISAVNADTASFPAGSSVLNTAPPYGPGQGPTLTPTGTLPAANKVQSGTVYGVAGTGSTGTLASSGKPNFGGGFNF